MPELEAEMTPAVKAAFLALLEQVEQSNKQVESLTNQVEKLTPRNSSLPPSTEHPHPKPKRKRPSVKKRNRGGQNGHKLHLRDLIPSEQCATVMPCHPDYCCRCGGEFQADGATPRRHQVWDLPPIEPVVVEYHLFRGHCPCCGITTSASLPPGVPAGQCGPRRAAFTGFWDEILPRKDHLWTFLKVEGIEPTNNTAERTLRPVVIYRKLSFGMQSSTGSRYLEPTLTVSEMHTNR